jgi:NADH-quinone oxidoreductase subunit F
MICGRVCPAFCEQRCRRGDIDAPVGIRAIKRFMADHEADVPWFAAKPRIARSEKVAVIGSGPAGLTAALRLAQAGFPVTVFEALSVPGGMMAVGIPEYRLPREVLNREIDQIRQAGVQIVCNRALGRDFRLEDLFDREGFKAAIVAIGAHRSLRLGIPGEEAAGVINGIDFLREVALGRPPAVKGRRVAVIGGGNVAVDAARTAWRLGAAEVHIVYRRTRQDMPAYPEEIEAAHDEGIIFHFLNTPVRILSAEGVTALEIQQQKLSEFDASGRRRPIPVKAALRTLSVDVVIPAIGQEPDKVCVLEAGIETNRNSTLKVGPSLATTREAVFAAGDAVSGPASVIEAVAQGNRVAKEVDHYLSTGVRAKVDIPLEARLPPLTWNMEEHSETPRLRAPLAPVAARAGNFTEVELPAGEAEIRKECRRCLRCDLEWGQLKQREREAEAHAAVH